MSLLDNFSDWIAAEPNARERAVAAVAESIAKSFTPLGVRGPLAQFRHNSSGMMFALVPGGTGELGAHNDEREQIELIVGHPMHTPLPAPAKIRIAPFLCAQAPLLESVARTLRPSLRGMWIAHFDDALRPGDDVPVAVEPEDALACANALDLRLMTSFEWEWVARSQGRHSWIATAEANWQAIESSVGHTVQHVHADAQAFASPAASDLGIWGLHLGEWVSDARAPEGYAIRGGAAASYPWQNTEDILLAHAAWQRPAHDACGDEVVRFAMSIG